MVKQNPSTNFNRDMNEYKMRTSYGVSTNYSQSNPSQYNHVQVAHSNGCCSSKNNQSIPPSQPIIQQTPRQITAHERSHLRHDPPDPFYNRYGRIKKNANRNKYPYQQKYHKNQINSTRPIANLQQTNQNYQYGQQRNQNYQYVQQTPQEKDSCCTIL
jgi:hypothetical protein